MMIELDGATGEGGGQILRSALALAMCTGQGVALHDIRARRPKPGLMRQHLACVQAAQAVSGARVQGADAGSMSLVFEPGAVCAGDHVFSVGTAGSATLVLQTVWPALMLADDASRLTLAGGTHNPMAPPFHFIERCYAPLLQRLGAGSRLQLRRHGFFPAGGGEFVAEILPAVGGLQPYDLLERGALIAAHAEALAAAVPRSVASRELAILQRELGWPDEALQVPVLRQNEGPGNALMATLVHEHVTELAISFGERGRSAEDVALSLAAELRTYQAGTGALGPHLADQWVLPLALAVWRSGRPAGFSCTELTEHARTNFAVIERFLPLRIATDGVEGHWRVAVAPLGA
jgi:RNA 3'-terminal phosphate cyclase (ATP)